MVFGMVFGIVFADGVDGYTVTLGKGIGNDLKALTVHVYVFGGGEAEVLDAGTFLGGRTCGYRVLGSNGCLWYGW